MPFVQGHLRNESITVTIKTQCAHCARPMQIEIDSELRYHCDAEDAEPMVFIPHVNFEKLKDPSIIDAF
jgi:hypothetical protein